MSKKDRTDRVIWCDRGWQTVFIGFCPSERAWKREMKKMGCQGEPYPNESAGRCTTFRLKGKVCVIVSIRDGSEAEHTQTEVLGLFVHEATHVWQTVRDEMGEKSPSIEFEAYSMQAIFQQLWSAWLNTRGTLAKAA